MLVTLYGTQTSETMDIHLDHPHTVGAILEILLTIHPWFFQALPPGRDKSTLAEALLIRDADNTALTVDDIVTNDTKLEIQFHNTI
ncbi:MULTISPECIES: hypothetical protein [Aneurinibacillus]|jgi:hypothetical protein|uniref:Uncharacterized protein n=1 Tax=Aneurinibacillus thermoaerophilus TaxID=143495 RepID=A0A1G8A5V8_ANETH|nr:MULTISPECIES: hypothetical protein [Aneurinibacillus]AMA74098.1 hypothetical protein ACH33_15590 [Aneurinibacillus sp. XH2]MED0675475.1 hypothetical protein [Aneurinibacillus thermoaerophilus]MED0678830.1 hypothetical protein [Aneurinibacillus thermoaerophilus]MED0736703.1 hypothetical protein [Aneurinibacillus thermoaerophilus]MED0758358.1 hypothetical protein [Aneurinibacillus thermoaerophilus]